MKKRTFSFLLALMMCLSLLPMTALAAGDTLKDVPIPKPAAPHYFMTDVEYEGWHGDIRIVTLFDNSMLELVRENDIDPEGFYAKYGITNEYYNGLYIQMQYDVNVDGRGWQYTPEWDEVGGYTGSYTAGYDQNYLHDNLVSEFTLVDLVHEESRELYGDIAYLSHQDEYGDDVWRFDLTNHSVQVRCRYYMEYYCNDEQIIRTGEWSDVAVIGKIGSHLRGKSNAKNGIRSHTRGKSSDHAAFRVLPALGGGGCIRFLLLAKHAVTVRKQRLDRGRAEIQSQIITVHVIHQT